MPNQDRTGPEGKGAKTGRMQGKCRKPKGLKVDLDQERTDSLDTKDTTENTDNRKRDHSPMDTIRRGLGRNNDSSEYQDSNREPSLEEDLEEQARTFGLGLGKGRGKGRGKTGKGRGLGLGKRESSGQGKGRGK